MEFSSLQSRPSSYIPPHRTQLHPRMHAFLSPPLSKSSSLFAFREKWLILLASLLTSPFLFYLFSTAINIHQSYKFGESKPTVFGVVIDASSAGSRIHIFEFLNEGMVPFLGIDGSGLSSLKVNTRLMDFANDPGGAGRSISPLVQFARQKVPKSEWRNTRIQLMARMELGKLGSEVMEPIFKSCRKVLRSSGFLFKDEWATLLKGEEEGLYTWVAANYALGNLGRDPHETTGIVELGGPSMQVAFAQKNKEAMPHSKTIKLAGIDYNLFIQSMPHFGQDAVWELLEQKVKNPRDLSASFESKEETLSNPCIPSGYEFMSNRSDVELLESHAAGNFSECKSKVRMLLKSSQVNCRHPPCHIVSSFFGESESTLPAPYKFVYASEFFGLVSLASLSELEAAGQHYCEDEWCKLKLQHNDIGTSDLMRYCFSAAYIVALLHESLENSVFDRRVRFSNQNGSIPPDWTLGAFIIQATLEPPESEANDLGEIVSNDAVTYFTLFAVLLSVVLGAFFLFKRQRPQLKTIYDLEKGQYIVTRVPR